MEIIRKKKYIIGIITVILIAILGALSVELKEPAICYSSVFTTPGQTEIQLHVIINSLLPVDEKVISQEIIADEQQINGKRNNSLYILNLYRSTFHYRKNWEYREIICNENGTIICYEEETIL